MQKRGVCATTRAVTFAFAVVLAVTATWWGCPWSRAAPSTFREPEFERKIVAELRDRDPKAADVFVEATAAYDAEDLDRAATLFEQVRAEAPWFVHATRRLCGVESGRGHRERAIALCREAFDADPSSVNEAALAAATLRSKGALSAGDIQEALHLAIGASQKESPATASTQVILCQASLAAKALTTLTSCTTELLRLAPDEMTTHYFAVFSDAVDGRLGDARHELEIARAKGLPPDAYRSLRGMLDDAEPPLVRWGRPAFYGLVAWIAGFLLLFAAGGALSAATLKSAAKTRTDTDGHARGADAVLRRTYRVVLWVTCAYYYLSLPIVALVVAGTGVAFVYACLAMGTIPLKLMLIVVLIVFGTLWGIAKSFFVRTRDEDPGEKLDLGDHPKLRATLDEVASRIGTRTVDAVYMSPGAEIAVFERGGMLGQLRGRGERCLVVGAAALDGLRVGPLKAILAHEYGHFHNTDTAGGGFALAVRRSLMTVAVHIARSGAASSLNPAWWFLRGFHAVFLRISQGASRLQEILADRWAAFAYGSDAFVDGLRHVIDRNVRFDAHVHATLQEVVPAKQPLANLYAFVPATPSPTAKIEEAVEQAMNRPAAPSDSHPRPADRIAWVTKLAAPARPGDDPNGDAEQAWDLFVDRPSIEESMTEMVRARLAKRGVRIASPEEAAPLAGL